MIAAIAAVRINAVGILETRSAWNLVKAAVKDVAETAMSAVPVSSAECEMGRSVA